MKVKVATLETKIVDIANEIVAIKAIQMPMKLKLDKLHDRKGEDNNKLQVFSCMLEMFKENQDNNTKSIKENQDNFAKSLRDEYRQFTLMFRDEMKSLSLNLAQVMKWQYKMTGGGIVVSAILVAIFKYVV